MKVKSFKLPHETPAGLARTARTAVLLLVALALAGCGGDKPAEPEAGEATDLMEAAAGKPQPAPPPPPPEPDGGDDNPPLPPRSTPDPNKVMGIMTTDADLPSNPNLPGNMSSGAEGALSVTDTLKQKAENGDREAPWFLGYKYYNGDGLPQDFKEAAKWLKMAANRNHPDAQHLLGLLHEEGKGITQSPVLAYSWYTLAARRDHAKAIEGLGRLGNTMSDEDIQEAERLARDFVPE